MNLEPADALVFFGMTGDLAFKKIFPALSAMAKKGDLKMRIIGVARSPLTPAQVLEKVTASLKEFGKDADPESAKRLCAHLTYISGDYQEDDTYERIKNQLGNAKRPLHYLAIPPNLFPRVVAGLAKANLTETGRIIVEKPFGRDLESARSLNAVLTKHFPETRIFRIDHYLGKEPVQNLIFFRLANTLIESSWNRHFIENVQVTLAESIGIEGRGSFYDEIGALRDVFQNHALQIIANLAMESPKDTGADSWRKERARLLCKVKALTTNDVVFGQFNGFLKEEGVAPNSKTETFAVAKLAINNDRWEGVPFYVRVGKKLAAGAAEVVVRFRQTNEPTFLNAANLVPNDLRLQLSPAVIIAQSVNVQKSLTPCIADRVEMIAHHELPSEIPPYERLLHNAALGDPSLFARIDSVEEAWRICDTVLASNPPVHIYEPGTWGPPAAEKFAPKGGWVNPVVPGKK